MKTQPIPSDFFVAGGALRLDTPSYVTRPADDELLKLALAGQFCYVLTPRQMGKSSLMSRTNQKLNALGVKTAIIDVTRVGPVTVEQWYLSLLTRFQRQLGLSVKAHEWWQARAFLGPVQRFTDFLRDVILTEIETESVVIFIDEIDATLKFEFRDAFFAAIRAMYNARPNDPALNRLTFILLGVASPPDLIKDRALTPFNIGQGIGLDEFTKKEAKILQDGLEAICPSQGETIFNRIYYWTNGYPYLTQKLCLTITQRGQRNWTDVQIDALVDELFLSEAARKDSNLQFVQDKTLSHPKRRQLLNLYKKVYQGEKVANDGQSIVQNQLKLSGLLKEEGGYLHTRNNIYTRQFDLAWVKENTAIDWVRIFAGAAAFVAIVAISLLVYNAWIEQRVEKYTLEFYQAKNDPQEQARSLADILRTEGFWGSADYDHQARELFYDGQMSAQQQLAYFDEYHQIAPPDLIEIVPGLYVALADVDRTDRNRPLLEAMADHPDTIESIKKEIKFWLNARQKVQQDDLEEALDQYNEAITLNGQNPATRYERAIVLAELERGEQALDDLEQVLGIAQSIPAPTSESISTPTVSDTPTQIQTKGTTDEPAIASVASSAQSETEPSVVTAAEPAPMPIITPTLAPFTSELDPSSKMIRRVQDLIQENSGLERAAANADVAQYPNLALVGALPSELSTATTVAIAVASAEATSNPVVVGQSTPIATFTSISSTGVQAEEAPPISTPLATSESNFPQNTDSVTAIPINTPVAISTLAPATSPTSPPPPTQFPPTQLTPSSIPPTQSSPPTQLQLTPGSIPPTAMPIPTAILPTPIPPTPIPPTPIPPTPIPPTAVPPTPIPPTAVPPTPIPPTAVPPTQPPPPTAVPVERNVSISLLSPAQNENVRTNEVQLRVVVDEFQNGDRLQLRAGIDPNNLFNEGISFTFDGSAHVANLNFQPGNFGFDQTYYWQVLVIAPDGTTLATSNISEFLWVSPGGGGGSDGGSQTGP